MTSKFWTSNRSDQKTVQSLNCIQIKKYMDLTAIWFTKYPEPFRGYHGSKLNRKLCLALFSPLINSWLVIPALSKACWGIHIGELHSGNDVGKTESFGRVGGLGQAWLALSPLMQPKSAGATTPALLALKFHNEWGFFFHVLQSLWMERWAGNCAYNLVAWATKIKAREIVQIVHLKTKEAKKAKPIQPILFHWIPYFFLSRSLYSKWLVSKAAKVAHSQDFPISNRKPNFKNIYI